MLRNWISSDPTGVGLCGTALIEIVGPKTDPSAQTNPSAQTVFSLYLPHLQSYPDVEGFLYVQRIKVRTSAFPTIINGQHKEACANHKLWLGSSWAGICVENSTENRRKSQSKANPTHKITKNKNRLRNSFSHHLLLI